MSNIAFCTAIVFPPETFLDESWIANVLHNDGSFSIDDKKTTKDIAPEHDICASDDAAFGIGTGNPYASHLGWLASLSAIAVKISALLLPLTHS